MALDKGKLCRKLQVYEKLLMLGLKQNKAKKWLQSSITKSV